LPSASTCAGRSPKLRVELQPFLSCPHAPSRQSLEQRWQRNGRKVQFERPDRILDRSRRSLIRSSRWRPLRAIVANASWRPGSASGRSRTSSAYPRIRAAACVTRGSCLRELVWRGSPPRLRARCHQSPSLRAEQADIQYAATRMTEKPPAMSRWPGSRLCFHIAPRAISPKLPAFPRRNRIEHLSRMVTSSGQSLRTPTEKPCGCKAFSTGRQSSDC